MAKAICKPFRSSDSEPVNHAAEDVDAQFERLIQNNSLAGNVMRLTSRGVGGYTEVGALRLLAVMLGESNERLLLRICELEGICPRIIEADGVRHRWDAPDEFVPVQKA